MPEIKDMYDRHPSIKSITLITVITRRVVSIEYRHLLLISIVIDVSNGFPISIFTMFNIH